MTLAIMVSTRLWLDGVFSRRRDKARFVEDCIDGVE